ncbi:TPA: cysteine desulfurase CsdA [bacterium]|nr:cysteine desulfurase CsdA [bacterium]
MNDTTSREKLNKLRNDFPVLHQLVRGRPLVYLDNAATTHKPRAVIDTLVQFYSMDNSNIHRGVHYLSEKATFAYEKARGQVKRLLHAKSEQEIVFTRGATEAINLVAKTFGDMRVKEGDEILISAMEHHSNIVPWQMLCEKKGARLKVIPMNDRGELLLDEYEKLLTEKTKIVSIVWISNSLGTRNPISEMIKMAHEKGIPFLVDAAQAVAHEPIDVTKFDCDFLVFSGHKSYGPTGVGVLYGKSKLLEEMPPWQGGGDMIKSVTFEKTLFADIPYKFEAGTPNIAGGIGLGASLEYLESIGWDWIMQHEKSLLAHGTRLLTEIAGLKLIGTAANKAGVLSFVMDGIHPHDIGTILDRHGIAIRTGHHCTQPVMQRMGVPATARASIALYNMPEELDVLAETLKVVKKVFER